MKILINSTILILLLNVLLIILSSICSCIDSDLFEHNEHSDETKSSESMWPSSLISIFESIVETFDKSATQQLDPFIHKLESENNGIIATHSKTNEIDKESSSNTNKPNTPVVTSLNVEKFNDYDETDRPYFDYNSPTETIDNSDDDEAENPNNMESGECETINGTIGECRSPPVCLKREPKRSAFSLCKWSHHPLTGARIPIKLCCEKRHSATIKDLTTEADIEKQWAKHLALGFHHIEQSSMTPFWNLVSNPLTLMHNSLVLHPQHNNQHHCGRTMFNNNHRRLHVIRYVFEIPDRRASDLESNKEFQPILSNQTNKQRNTRAHSPRIVSGVSVANGEIPWIVSIYSRDTFTCGGSLISDRFVLTAAHCFNNANRLSDWFYIRYGSNVIHEGPAIPVKSVIIHPGYKPPVIYHDIALLELMHPVRFSSFVQPVCLATTRMYAQNMVGLKATVSGYGDSGFEGKQSDFLQAVDIKVIENQFCDKHYRRLAHADTKFRYGIGRTLICAGYEQGVKDACQGDSGGPLTIQIGGIHYQIGIVSFGYRCAQPDFPGIYTSVSHYRQWIESHIHK